MKAKTTWLIGLLIALMMVVTAVPAFAQDAQPAEPDNQDVAVEAQADPQADFVSVKKFSVAKDKAYTGGTIKFNVTLLKEKNTTTNMPYSIRIKDISSGVTAKPKTMTGITVTDIPIDSVPQADTIEKESITIDGSADPTILGEHTFKIYRVTTVEGQPKEEDLGFSAVKVTVYNKLTAYQTAHDQGQEGTLTGEIGKPVTLSAFAEGGYGSYTYEWQKSDSNSSAGEVTADNWTRIATGDAAQYTMQYGDNDKYIRCVVKDGDGNAVVASVENPTRTVYAVKLVTTSTGTITITAPTADSTVTKVVGQQFGPITIAATGGTTEGAYNYQWKKGNENVGGNIASFSIANVTAENAGSYKCVVTDQTYPEINATSKTTILRVVEAPNFSIDANKGTNTVTKVAGWGDSNAAAEDGNGTLSISNADAASGLTLSLDVNGDLNDPARTIAWSGVENNIDPTQSANKTSVTIPAGQVKTGTYTATVSYPGYSLPASIYRLTVNFSGGSLSATDGGIFKQTGTADPTVSPKYTITLPTGLTFDKINVDGDISGWMNKPTGLTAIVKERTSNALTFQFENKASQVPYVADLQITVPHGNINYEHAGATWTNTDDIVIPSSSAYGFQITGSLTTPKIKIEKPGTSNTSENVYDGNAIAAKIVKNDENDPDIGTVTNVRYLSIDKYNEIYKDNKIIEKDTAYYNASTTTVPKDANDYKVWCDVVKGSSKAYPDGATKLGPLDYKINPATTTTMRANAEDKDYKTYFTWTKAKKKTGSKLDADVAFKSGLTNKGKITSIVYKKDGVQINPVDVGIYTIEVTTAADGEKNPASNVTEGTYHIGTFEITDKDPVPETKKDPTKDLYEMSPTSATADGKAHTTTVSIKDEYSDAGEVTATNYYDKNGTKVSGSPTKVGEYTVKIDTKETDTYKAAKDLEIGKFTIKGATPTASMYTMDPKSGSSVTANGKGQGVTVKAVDPKVAGEPTVKYYDAAGKAVSGQPVKAGKYTVKIDTAASDYYAAGEDIAMGTFEITQGTPTKAMNLYKLDPATNDYTGKANPTKVVPAGDNGAGEVEAIHYTRKSTKVKESDEGPVAVGVYTVTVDTKASDTFKAVKGLEVGDYEIVDHGIFLRAHVENEGWQSRRSLDIGQSADVGSTGLGRRLEALQLIVPDSYKVIGFAHVENEGDIEVRKITTPDAGLKAQIPDGYTAYEFGTTGRGLRMEAVCVGIQNASGEYLKGLQYRTHLQNYGWQGNVRNGSFAGTRKMGLRVESIRFTYSNDDVIQTSADHADSVTNNTAADKAVNTAADTATPDIYFCAHVENQGWDKSNKVLKAGQTVDMGTTGRGLRVEALAVMVPETYKVTGFGHVQDFGDMQIAEIKSSQDYTIPAGYKAYQFGTVGHAKQIEAVCISIKDASDEYVKGFQYATHLQNFGWQGYVRNGSFAGSRAMALRMESIRFTYADPDVVKANAF